MKCKCGYEGPANVVDELKSDTHSFWECPDCKSSKGIQYITGIDVVRKAMLTKNQRVIFTQGGIWTLSNDGRKGIQCRVDYKISREKQSVHSDHPWISADEYKELKKWAMKKNIFDDYCEEFAMTDCTICQKEIDFKCRLIAKRIVGECRGKIHETMAEANWPDNNRYEGLYKYYYRKAEEV